MTYKCGQVELIKDEHKHLQFPILEAKNKEEEGDGTEYKRKIKYESGVCVPTLPLPNSHVLQKDVDYTEKVVKISTDTAYNKVN